METLHTFLTLFWISLLAALVTGIWWFIMTQRRETWLRWTNAEAAFWRKTKMPASIIESTNRMEQSRGFTILVGLTCLFLILLVALNAGAYLYFREKYREKRPPNLAAAGNGAMALLFQIQHLRRAVPEQYSSGLDGASTGI